MRDGSRPGPSGASAGHGFEKDDEGSSASEDCSYEELMSLKELLHFPEEVALRLTDTEYQLFYQVPPIDYLRQVTLDLGGSCALGSAAERPVIRRAPPTRAQQATRTVRALIHRFNEAGKRPVIRRAPPTRAQQATRTVRALIHRFNEAGKRPVIRRAPPTRAQQATRTVRALIHRFNEAGKRPVIRRAPPTRAQQATRTVRALIHRFNEVSAWVTELVLSQAAEDRKAALACVLRVALTCWNIGNFNGAMEIVAGLKSTKLKSFWTSVSDEPLPALDFLSAALLSAEYERALGRALAMPECRLVPFFGAFLRELRSVTYYLIHLLDILLWRPRLGSRRDGKPGARWLDDLA
ncbi:uncharacterized protein LOC134676589 [Cydia fagiglandana]|uniref:uncharacterized protein LOC134676589 n=1 Tax=Cydia fagiglandana TaxID=1458189 RepID=UPI002FEE0286